jgi:O6-methylguanine-DNA--protein-cysteine methyltransferase
MAEITKVYFSRIDSSVVGPLLLAATENGLRCVHFHKGNLPASGKDEVWIESRDYLRPYEMQLEAYFHGDLREFTCKLDLIGTQFQKIAGTPYYEFLMDRPALMPISPAPSAGQMLSAP